MGEAAPDLGPASLLIAGALVLVHGGLSVWLRLGLTKRLAIAVTRMVVQLLLLGYVLVPVFQWGHPLPILAVCLAMLLMATRAAIKRPSRRWRGMGPATFGSLALGAGVSALIGTTLVIQPDPWWSPRFLIPVLGMILGNGLTGISLGLDRCLALFDEHRDRVESLLAYGATPWEAARPVAAESIRTGLIPIMNTMTVVGVVSIPGMMTGQLLGGTPPGLAARYQIAIICLIAGATAVGVLGAVLATTRALFDEAGRLRPERLIQQG
ncbi:MAG: ABC transporter permease [Bradymonadia bacterium]